MNSRALADLKETLTAHVPLGKSRLETLCLLLLGMISARTVNLTHIATERPGRAKVASTYRRLQRFFQHVVLPEDWAVGLVVALIGRPQKWYLCLDRTNWKIGKADVNILVLAVVTEKFRVPLMWSLLAHCGNSTTAQRIDLMRRYLARFEASTVRMLLADREFIGQEWFAFLKDHGIPFAVRLKEEQIIRVDGRELSLRSWLSRCKGERGFTAVLPAKAGHPDIELHFGARRIKGGELLVVASSLPASGGRILRYYRKRWFIECLFADSKTKGLNIEDTRLTLAHKLSLLVAITAIAIALVCRAAVKRLGQKYPARKKHGYCERSWFRTGFDELRRRLRSGQDEPIVDRKIVIPKSLRLRVV
ncbi:IS4 family transposase [Pontitalea aquivivens]|uniref:IS4 family transposase n=1 Tax=Pontitalea aquivivens TaxID=3388663 RepID=UPI003970C48B